MMLLKIDINKWFSWLNLGIKDPSTASAVEVLLQIAVICLIAFLFTFFLPSNEGLNYVFLEYPLCGGERE